MNALLSILTVILRALIPVLFEKSQDTYQDAAPQDELGDKLRKRIKKTWGKTALLLVVVLFLPGCFVRTIYVPDGTPVRLREPIKNAKVWVLDKDGNPVKGVMDLPEGWYCLPMKDEEK